MVKKNIHDDHSNATHVTLSSIALLQERFRQLEKMKELRQEKEHLKMLSRLSGKNTITPHEPLQEHGPHCQLSLSLRPDSQRIKYEDQGPSRNSAKSCFTDDEEPIALESHIDTSLRL
ncbi:hypothetical protein CASFOL_040604 [Castilleja foliolosa]|uniref:Uncharacterized protein n=1 Tax=Castilleja foliolosa TaxID=1961234 RepID=A0ABD3BCK6_9LAMI